MTDSDRQPMIGSVTLRSRRMNVVVASVMAATPLFMVFHKESHVVFVGPEQVNG
jgi:hypothetical protein